MPSEKIIRYSVANAIDKRITYLFKEMASSFPFYLEASVKNVKSDGTYDVMINGELYENVKTTDNTVYKVNDVVMMLYPKGASGNKYIAFKR